ncbi:unnamed protein product, partial [Schistosoma intercalatum]
MSRLNCSLWANIHTFVQHDSQYTSKSTFFRVKINYHSIDLFKLDPFLASF